MIEAQNVLVKNGRTSYASTALQRPWGCGMEE